ncbi:hypothetical protein [Actinotalea sp. C106]|uniref:hypothetical protein n=1 Tax=Actinotalea sp. C106 TaxID=2908644 RepID=UPI002027A0AD|nr:hypothetical protein [Actinotalea sp. C106]
MTRHRHDGRARRRHPRWAATLALLTTGAVAACSSAPEFPCDPHEVFESEAGPGDEVTTTDSDGDTPEDSRLLHEQDGASFFLVQWAEQDAGSVCLWMERDDDFVSHMCGGSPVGVGAPPAGLSATYDTSGEVDEHAGSDLTAVSDCLAVSTDAY